MVGLERLVIDLGNIQSSLLLYVYPKKSNTVFSVPDAVDYFESPYQLLEGCNYEYEFNDENYYFLKDQIVKPRVRNKYMGVISTNIFVGTIMLPIYCSDILKGKVELEVQSIKASYRDDYRRMLNDISELSTELAMQVNSLTYQYFEANYLSNSQTLFQKFELIKTLIFGKEFDLALQKIITVSSMRWEECLMNTDIRGVRRVDESVLRQIVSGSNRIQLNEDDDLYHVGIVSVPRQIQVTKKKDSYDTLENRFIKYTLQQYLMFCNDVNSRAQKDTKIFNESMMLIEKLELILSEEFFKDISMPKLVTLNSPVLQRKEGYREMLKYWGMFDTACKLSWENAEEIYGAGKKNVALVYEYWVFFTLLDVLRGIVNIDKNHISQIVTVSKDGFRILLKKGQSLKLVGTHKGQNGILKIRLSYNKLFKVSEDEKVLGSWSIPLKPDYTISIWPEGLSEKEAEEKGLLAHIHFDAKYKVNNLDELIDLVGREEEDDEEDDENQEIIRTFKNIDIVKMHAYKDAIRRSKGAYILYPGQEALTAKETGDEIAGIGALPLNPSKDQGDKDKLKKFLVQIINNYEKQLLQSN